MIQPYRARDLLVALIGLTALYLLLGLQNFRFTEPLMLVGDHIFLLDMIKESMNGVGVFNENLGAPLHKTEFYFPLFDGSYKGLIWVFSRFTSNVFLVVSLFYVTGIALIFTATFWSLRVLGVGPYLSCVASVAFVMTPYLAVRAFSHDLLSMYYSVPMGATLALIFSRGDLVRRARSPFGVCAVLLAGTSGLYYGFFTAMFLGLVSTSRSIREKSFGPIVACAVVSVVLLLLLVFSAYNYHMWRWFIGGQGLVSPPHRYIWEQLYHGLLISTALHVYSDLGFFVDKFAEYKSVLALRPGLGDLTGEGYLFEWPGAFLTTIILASPLALFTFIGNRTGRAQKIAICFACMMFGLIFAIRGGLGYVFGFLFIGAIRAQERILPFLTFFAIVAVCLGCASLRRRNHRLAASVLAGCALLTSIYPAINLFPKRQHQFLATEETYRQSILDVLAAKNRSGLTTIFQLPVMQWPESPPQGLMTGEEHTLPYIFDTVGSKTRWSYGLSATEISPLVAMATIDAEVPVKARAAGFDGILVEKTGYAPERAASLVAALARSGACIRHEDRFRVLFAICN
jgi:hypothetical protein